MRLTLRVVARTLHALPALLHRCGPTYAISARKAFDAGKSRQKLYHQLSRIISYCIAEFEVEKNHMGKYLTRQKPIFMRLSGSGRKKAAGRLTPLPVQLRMGYPSTVNLA